MSKLGNIQESYGKQIGIAVANTYGENVLTSTTLPSNNIIIAAPVDEDVNDIGTYTLFITDNNGTPIRLSYTIQVGNGLNTNETDVVKLNIDNISLQTNIDGALCVATENIIDSSLSTDESDILQIKTENLNIANEEEFGVVGIDDYTIKTNQQGEIYIETENLDKANESQIGIVKSDNDTIHINSNGVISVNTQNLNYATYYSPGIVKLDGNTINLSYGNIKVNTNNLKYATSDSFGISKGDNVTIVANNGIYSVKTLSLNKCSEINYGIAKGDTISTIISNDRIGINDYDNIVNKINDIKTRITVAKNTLEKLSNNTTNVNLVNITDPTIFTFMCNSVTSVNLTRPKYNTLPSDFIQEKITSEFTVNTNCPFIITITYLDNISPSIYLYSINYDDLDEYPGDLGLYNEYQSTNGVNKILRFSWICKNYASSNSNTESLSTRIKITISYSKGNDVSQTVYYNIIRYNSLYKKTKIDKTLLTPNLNGTLNITDSSTKSKYINNVKIKKQTT